MFLGNAFVSNVLRDNRRSDLDSRLAAILFFAEKLTLFPEAVTAEDITILQSEGLSESAISEGIMVVALFSLITRVADALHFDTPSDLSTGADLLRRFGYFGMASPWSLFTSDPAISRAFESRDTTGNLSDSMMRWLESVASLGSVARVSAPVAAGSLVDKVMCNPDDVSERDVAELKSHSITEEMVFDLILSAAASASLMRMRSGYDALRPPIRKSMMVASAAN